MSSVPGKFGMSPQFGKQNRTVTNNGFGSAASNPGVETSYVMVPSTTKAASLVRGDLPDHVGK